MDKKIIEASGICRNKDEFFEFVRKNRRHRDRKIRPVLLVCTGICVVFCIYDIIMLESVMALLSAGFAFLMFYSSTFSYIPEAMKLYETEKNGVLNVPISYCFYDNRFSVTVRGKEAFYSYSRINDVRSSKTKLYFFTEDKTFYVDKSSLDGETAVQLKAFLKEMRKK